MLKKILSFYTKYFAIWVVAFGVVAYVWPGPFVALKSYMNWFFALTMFGIGAVLEVADFKRIAQRPAIVLIGSAAQFSIMPLGAFVLARLFELPPEISVGLILTGSAPGAMASNVMSYIAKADTAYSVSLTTVSTLLCPLLTPALTFILARSSLEVPFLDMVGTVVATVVVPLFTVKFAAVTSCSVALLFDIVSVPTLVIASATETERSEPAFRVRLYPPPVIVLVKTMAIP